MLWGSKGRELGNTEGLVSHCMVKKSFHRKVAFAQASEGSEGSMRAVKVEFLKSQKVTLKQIETEHVKDSFYSVISKGSIKCEVWFKGHSKLWHL